MGAAILNILSFIKIKICFIKVVIFIKCVYFGGNDCLSLELKDYKNIVAKVFLKPFIIWFCIFNLGWVMSQSLQYGGVHDSHFKYIQTIVTSLFLG